MAKVASMKALLKKLGAQASKASKDPNLQVLTQRLFEEAVAEDLAALETSDLLLMATGSLEFLKDRKPGRPIVRLLNHDHKDGQLKSVSIVEIVNDDMPFLLDSVLGLLTDKGHEISLVLHPILNVERDRAGRLQKLVPARTGSAASVRESLIHIHLERITGKAATNQLLDDIATVLNHVRLSVLDWRTMQSRVKEAVAAYQNNPPPVPVEELTETMAFLQWLLDNHFTFLGIREYRFVGGAEKGELKVIDESGLGILRDPDTHVLRRGKSLVTLTPEIRSFLLQPALLFITKSDVVANVHRRAAMDYIGIKQFDDEGNLSGELRVVGLFTSTAYTHSPRGIPVIRRKISGVVARSGLNPESHSGKALLNVLETFPRDELMQIDVESLATMALGIMRLEERPRTRLFVRRDKFDRFVSAFVYVSRDRFNSELRRKIGELLASAYEGTVTSFSPSFGEGALVRVHFNIARNTDADSKPSSAKLENQIAEMARTWDDRLFDAIDETFEPDEARRLRRKYRDAFSPGYQEAFTPQSSLYDIREIEALQTGEDVAVEFYRVDSDPEKIARLKLYHYDVAVPLSDRLPILENMGLRAIAESSFTLTRFGTRATRVIHIHEVQLEAETGGAQDIKKRNKILEQGFLAVWNGMAENDRYNSLIMREGLEWRDIAILRACGKYLRQAAIAYSADYMATTLVKHSGIAGMLCQMFHARFDPKAGSQDARKKKISAIKANINETLQAVPSLDEDLIVRRFVNLINSIYRTNFYQRTDDGGLPATMSFKINSRKITDLPEPRPFAEIFVYSPDVEGVHLRAGRIARGGLRWSDRPEDFRTEVLGLAKAQNVKNAVIVPVGSKGGFVPKKLPAGGSREEVFAEGTRAYKLFISSLLEITDNIEGPKIVRPKDVVRYDGDDPYLVVAADKGTATFSDTANGLAIEHGFWLDDAFASGGSAGYDHKAMGITARGGWEAVKRHFRELNIDIQTTPFTVAGVGDMSGDVFGNGMLLSEKIKLIAAFDHRDIFFDPDPDPATSFAERKRLFALPRSSWNDYNTKLMSKGGGIFSRQLKSIPLSSQMREWTGLRGASTTPNELLTAILRMKIDLLWFGGIGTYIRATSETDSDAGDRANDAIRITANQLRAKSIGEGANLGLTHRARIEFAANGGRVNTDAVDNSAGVNSSDLEVNIKIALSAAEAAGKLTRPKRNRLLADMTDEVAELVLRNNYLQTLCLSTCEARGTREAEYLCRLMRDLESRNLLDRQLEFLPDDGTVADRQAHNQGLLRPEISVLMAYAKMVLFDELLQTDVPDDPYFEEQLFRYFPAGMQKKYAAEISNHRLRREIIATMLANGMINRGGPTFILRLQEETGHDVAHIAKAYAVARDAFSLIDTAQLIDALDNQIDGGLQVELYVQLQRILRRATIWFLRNETFAEGLAATVTRYNKGIGEVSKNLKGALPAHNWSRIEDRVKSYTKQGVPEGTAQAVSGLRYLLRATDIVQVAAQSNRPVTGVAKTYFTAGIALGVDRLIVRSDEIDTTRYYDKLAVNRSIDGILQTLRGIVVSAMSVKSAKPDPWTQWSSRNEAALARVQRGIDELLSETGFTLAKLAVASSQLSDLAVETG
ncbi:MAG: NAD-glutamate dehydrogenase [Rhizobiales bacterium]|nr:NAD-glutamate dehydrogenase [Hyphomicrobiales bacterium]